MAAQPGNESVISFGNFSHMNERPTMPQLYSLKRNDGRDPVRIIDKIGASNSELGTQLLNDKDGAKMDIIRGDAGRDNIKINAKIFKQWRQESGAPVTWKQLVDTLVDVKLIELAKDIVDALEHADLSD